MFSSNCKSKKVLNLAQKKVTVICVLFKAFCKSDVSHYSHRIPCL